MGSFRRGLGAGAERVAGGPTLLNAVEIDPDQDRTPARWFSRVQAVVLL
ncbi:MAG: hypothetical protein HC837_10830 [Chloroflexaceae bacterium]|nr:hypothetical protein [Chloroflexaceae bacterium]